MEESKEEEVVDDSDKKEDLEGKVGDEVEVEVGRRRKSERLKSRERGSCTEVTKAGKIF